MTTKIQLIEEIIILRNAIRRHQSKQAECRQFSYNDLELYEILPEKNKSVPPMRTVLVGDPFGENPFVSVPRKPVLSKDCEVF